MRSHMLAAVATACVATLHLTTAAAAAELVQTPFGLMPAHCVHEVPNGARVRNMDDGSVQVTAVDGSRSFIPRCVDAEGNDLLGSASARAVGGLPPDYDGWLAYTALNITDVGRTGGFDAFTSTMSVPDEPKQRADILYFFPGLQNIDWIPKVDPEPTASNPFDIIQPVLQYPGGLFGGWALKSWYVTVNAGALFSEAITGIKEGDSILCNMTRTGDQSWIISGAVQKAGSSDPPKATVQRAENARLKLQPWAYSAVAECYGCQGCDTFPTKPITFTDNKLYQGGELVDVKGSDWAITPKKPVKLECHEQATVADNGDATISFQ